MKSFLGTCESSVSDFAERLKMAAEYTPSSPDESDRMDESDRITRWILGAPNPAERNDRFNRAPLPPGSALISKIAASFAFDQDRLRLSPSMAANMRKVRGIVFSLRADSMSANALTPASAQVVIRVNWIDGRSTPNRYHDFFLRATAYSASYDPHLSTGHPRIAKNRRYRMRHFGKASLGKKFRRSGLLGLRVPR